jgi:small subunit ribosomal protein S3
VGQKTHPLGFRLVTVQDHRSIWFSNFNNYSNLLEEDDKIRTSLSSKIKPASISKISIVRDTTGNKIKLDIHSARPGILVGQAGSGIGDIYKYLKKSLPLQRQIEINVVEVTNPDREANLIADYIVEQLEKRIAFKRAMRRAIQRAQDANVEGIKVQVSGRLNGAEIARSEWVREGRVPLQTLRADVDYASKPASTIYGVLGIKVWLFRGEII